MTLEEILPGLKAKKNMYETGWEGLKTMFNFDTIEQNGVALSDALFPHQRVWRREGFSM